MKKAIIGILVIVIFVGGGYFGYTKLASSKKEPTATTSAPGTVWNPYSKEERILYTLPDYVISAAKGNQIVKMTVTLEFNEMNGYYKFLGYKSAEDGEKELKNAKEASGKENKSVSPMEVEINSLISSYMLGLKEDQVHAIDVVETGIRSYLNQKLDLYGSEKENFIKRVYIENVVID